MSMSTPQSLNDDLGQYNGNPQASPSRFIGLRTKLSVSFAVLTILVAIVLIAGLYIQVRNNLRRSTQQHMIEIVSVAALQVDADANATLTDPSQESSDTYLKIKRILQSIRNASTDIRYVYTVRYINNQEMFIVDAETDPKLISHLGNIYQDALPSALSKMAVANRPYIEPEINTDQWGTWVTSCAPLYRVNGTRGDFLCMDISASNQVSQERHFLWIALAILAVMLPFAAGIGWWVGDRLAVPLTKLKNGADHLAEGDTQYKVNVPTRDEASILARSFNLMVNHWNEIANTLKHRVEEQTQEVERRSAYLTAAAELSRVASANLDATRLIQQSVEIIQKGFGLYYVGLFLLSEDGKWAELCAGTGKAGEDMISRQHHIPIGEGMIGWCIANAQTRIAQEVSQDSVRFKTPELPNTRSEAAIPLKIRGRIIGALSFQSERENTFDEIMMETLQTLTNQVAVALDNVRLLVESREAYSLSKRASSAKSQAEKQKEIGVRQHIGYYADAENTLPLDENNPGLELVKLEAKNVLHLPIRVRGQVLGTIHARKPDTEGAWNTEEIALLSTLADQLSLALDNARLYQDTQRSAEREHIISEITTKVRASTNVNAILQTAVRELADALRVSKATVQLNEGSDHEGVDHRDGINRQINGDDSNA